MHEAVVENYTRSYQWVLNCMDLEGNECILRTAKNGTKHLPSASLDHYNDISPPRDETQYAISSHWRWRLRSLSLHDATSHIEDTKLYSPCQPDTSSQTVCIPGLFKCCQLNCTVSVWRFDRFIVPKVPWVVFVFWLWSVSERTRWTFKLVT
jgi:hypothetical protein